jgi:hypothetical protein
VGNSWQHGHDAAVLLEPKPDQTSTGLLTAGLRVVDVDVDDAAIVAQVTPLAALHLPAGALRRSRGGPRFALVFRADEGQPAKRVCAGAHGKVEVLGAGQQVLVHGIHPEGQRYVWAGGRDPATVKLADVPSITEAQLTAFLDAVRPRLGPDASGTSRAVGPAFHSFGPASPRMAAHMASFGDSTSEFSAGLPDRGWFDQLTATVKNAIVRACTLAIDNTVNDPRDQWRNVLFALRDAFDRGADQAYQVALEWSQRGAGYTNDDAVDAVWNSTRPRQGGITVGTLLQLGQDNGEDLSGFRPAAIVPAAATALVPPLAFAATTVPPFSTAGARRILWLLGTSLARGMVSLLGAKTKAGKTALLVALALSLASGRDLLGLRTLGRPLRVLTINMEEMTQIWLMRFRAALILHGIPEAQIAQHLTVMTAADLPDLRLTKAVAGGTETVDLGGFARLEALITGFDVVILDPLMAMLGSDVSTNAVMAEVMLMLNSLAQRHGLAILVSHHERKGAGTGGEGLDAIMGASALVNHCRVAIGIRAMTEKEASRLGIPPDQAWRYFTITGLGSNHAPSQGDVVWLERRGVTILGTAEPPDYPEDEVAVAVCRATISAPGEVINDAMRLTVLRAIDAGADGMPLSDHHSAGSRKAQPIITSAIAVHTTGLSEAQREAIAGELLPDLLKREWVRRDPNVRVPKFDKKGSKNGHKLMSGLVVDWNRTPWASNTRHPDHPGITPMDQGDQGEAHTTHPSVHHPDDALGGVGVSGVMEMPQDLNSALQSATYGISRQGDQR